MSLENVLSQVDGVDLSGQLLEQALSDYCRDYQVDPEVFSGDVLKCAYDGIADVVLCSMVAALSEDNFDFEELLVHMNFGEFNKDVLQMQERLLKEHEMPAVLAVEPVVYKKRYEAMKRVLLNLSKEVG